MRSEREADDTIRRVARALLLVVAATAGACTAPGGATGGQERPAPDFSLPDVHGKTVSLAESGGQVRLVDFWATWCAPCREAIPDLKELHRKYGDKGLTILAISMDDDATKVLPAFIEKWELPYTNLIGNEKVAEGFGGVFGLPTTFLVDRKGTIVETWFGGTPRDVLEKRIRAVLGLDAAG